MSGLQHVESDQPIVQMASTLANAAPELARKYGMSHFDLCVALANACGFIMAEARRKHLTATLHERNYARTEDRQRMAQLMSVMAHAYDSRSFTNVG